MKKVLFLLATLILTCGKAGTEGTNQTFFEKMTLTQNQDNSLANSTYLCIIG